MNPLEILRSYASLYFVEQFFFFTVKYIYDTHIKEREEKYKEARSINSEAFVDFEKEKIDYTMHNEKEKFIPLYVEHRNLACTIIKGKVIRRYKNSIRNPTVELPAHLSMTMTSNIDPLIKMELQRILKIIKDEFGEQTVEIFRLLSDGYQYGEIANELNLPEGTVKTKIFRTRKYLKQ